MAKIPVYDRELILQRAVPNLVDPTAIERASAPMAGLAKIADAIGVLANKHKEAEDLTATNEALISGEKQKIELADKMRQESMANPDGFAKNFDKTLLEIDDQIASSLPSSAAKQAYKKTASVRNLGVFEDNLKWENRRKTEKYAESIERSANDLSVMALRAGREGLGIDNILNDADASTVAASSFLAPDKISEVSRQMRKNITANWLDGITEKNPAKAKALLDSKRYDNDLGADQIERAYFKVEARQKQAEAEAKAAIVSERNVVDSRFDLALAQVKTSEDINNIERQIREQGVNYGEAWTNEKLVKLVNKNQEYVKKTEDVALGGVFAEGKAYLNPADSNSVKAFNRYYEDVAINQMTSLPQEERNPLLAKIVVNAGVVPDALKGDIQAAAKSRNPDSIASAADLIDRITAESPHVLQDFPQKDIARISMVSDLIKSGHNPKEALELADKATDPMNKPLIDARKETLKKEKLDYTTKAMSAMTPFFLARVLPSIDAPESGIDTPSAAQQANMGFDYKNAYDATFLQTGSTDLAEQYAEKTIKSQYALTKVNGVTQVMKHAPEMYYSIPNTDSEWIRKQAIDDAKSVMKESMVGAGVDLEKDLYIVADPFATPRTATKKMPVYKLMVRSAESGALIDVLGPNQYWKPDVKKKRGELVEEVFGDRTVQ